MAGTTNNLEHLSIAVIDPYRNILTSMIYAMNLYRNAIIAKQLYIIENE